MPDRDDDVIAEALRFTGVGPEDPGFRELLRRPARGVSGSGTRGSRVLVGPVPDGCFPARPGRRPEWVSKSGPERMAADFGHPLVVILTGRPRPPLHERIGSP